MLLALYRSILYLYPAAYRGEFGDEMLEVLSEVAARIRKKSALGWTRYAAREAGGLLYDEIRVSVSQGHRGAHAGYPGRGDVHD